MEIKVYKSKELRLLPNVFKKVGVIVILASIVGAVLIATLLPQLATHYTGFAVMDLLIIGLFIISASKDKVEDERIMYLRINTMSFGFISAVITTLILPFVSTSFGDALKDTTGQLVVFYALMMHLMWFWMLKRKGK